VTHAAGLAKRTQRRLAAASVLVFLALFVHLHDSAVLVPPQGRTLLETAANLAGGRGFLVRPDVPLGRYPPLYPALLAVAAAAKVDPVPAVVALNAAAFAATLYGLVLLGAALGLRHLTALFVVALLLPSGYFLLRAARPDGWMSCAAVFALLGAVRYLQRPTAAASWLAGVSCALAAGARYMAIFTIWPVVALALLVGAPNARARLRSAALFGATAVAPLGLWVVRNLVVTGYASGMSRSSDRFASGETHFSANVVGTIRSVWIDLFGWDEMGARTFVYDGRPLAHPDATLALALVAAAIVLLLLVAQRRTFAATLPRLWPVLAYLGLYPAALVTLWTFGNNDPINTRYVAPLYPLLVVVGFAAFEALERASAPRWQRGAFVLLGLLVVAPAVPRSLALLGETPPERMMEVRTRRLERWQWQRDFAWDAIPAPGTHDPRHTPDGASPSALSRRPR